MAPILPHEIVEPVSVFRGTLVHSKVYGVVEYLRDTIVVVGASSGKILHVLPGADEEGILLKYNLSHNDVRRLADTQFLCPGFIDTHIHAPQYVFAGTGTDLPLMDWLKKYTFPTEESFQDPKSALTRYSLLVKRLLGLGTTTATYYGTIHLEQCKILADLVEIYGQRAVLGKVNMDRNSPETYIEDAETGVAEADEFVQYCQAKDCTRVMPCITPRFIPTCSLDSMKSLAEVAKKYGVHIQTHISESLDEMAFVKSLHAEAKHDGEILEEAGLLHNKSILAHATLLTDEETELLIERGCGIAHCPLSNFFVSDAFFRVNHSKKQGLKVGLGTDVAGGYSPSMLDSMRSCVINSRALRTHKITMQRMGVWSGNAEEDVLTFKEAFWLATQGGAEVLGLEDMLGSFEVGKEFDAVLVETAATGGPFDVFDVDSLSERFEKFINLGDDRNISEVYVQGRCVKRGDVFLGCKSKQALLHREL